MENLPGRRTGRRRVALLLLALLTVLLLLAYTRRYSLRERWLEAQSVESLRQLANQKDADALTAYVYARRLVDADRMSEAVELSTHAMSSLTPSLPSDLLKRVIALSGYIAAQWGSEENAGAWLQQAASLRADDMYFWLGKGVLALRQRHVFQAVEAFTEATRKAPARKETWRALGKALLHGLESQRAVEAYRQAVAAAPQNPQCYADLGQALQADRQFTAAEEAFRTAARLAPQNPKFTSLPAIGAAYAARTESEYRQAVQRLQEALATSPADIRLRAILAGLHMRFLQSGAARKELETLLAQDPDNKVGRHKLALVCEQLGDTRGAAEATVRYWQLMARQIELVELKKEALLHRNDATVFLRLAAAFQRAGKNREAAVALEQAAKLRPNDPRIAQSLRTLQSTPPPQERPAEPMPEEDTQP